MHERDLVNATAVCKRWRRTLIFTPTLWNKIIYSKYADPRVIAPRVQTYLERSGSVPLEVQIHINAFRLFYPHTERISSLEIFLDHKSYLYGVAQHISKSAPLLETMTVHATGRDSPKLSPIFFEALHISVRALNVRGVILAPGPSKFSQITNFTLETRLQRFTTTALLDLIGEMPLLRFLEARIDCASLQDHKPEKRVITLLHLEEVTITTDEGSRVPLPSPIIPALCLPSVRRVNMGLIGARGAPRTPFLPPAFEVRLPALSTTPKVSLTVYEGFNIEFFGSDQSRLTLHINSPQPFAFSKAIFGGTPFDSVLKLYVRFQRSWTTDLPFFFGMLQAMERLEYLEMKQNTTQPLVFWAMVQDDRTLICPALTTLIVTDTDFDEVRFYVEELQEARERAGLPIARVEVRNGLD